MIGHLDESGIKPDNQSLAERAKAAEYAVKSSILENKEEVVGYEFAGVKYDKSMVRAARKVNKELVQDWISMWGPWMDGEVINEAKKEFGADVVGYPSNNTLAPQSGWE